MAQKRMFNKMITNDDNFLEMPCSSQVLYFHLSMNADDDGFVNNWKSIMRMTGTKEDDLKVLITKQYIIPFDSGVIVIKHWRLNNYLQKDRTIPTQYQEELKQLQLDNNNVYEMYTKCIHSIDKNSIDKNSIEKEIYKEKENYGEYHNVLLTNDDFNKLKSTYTNYQDLITCLDEYIESLDPGAKKKYLKKNHYLCIKRWVVEAVSKKKTIKQDIKPEWFDKQNVNINTTQEGIKEFDKILKELTNDETK